MGGEVAGNREEGERREGRQRKRNTGKTRREEERQNKGSSLVDTDDYFLALKISKSKDY